MRRTRRFRVQAVSRVLLLCATAAAVCAAWIAHSPVLSLLLCALLIIEAFSLVRYVESSNRALASFLEAVRYADFSQSFVPTGLGPGYEELHKALADISAEFQRTREAKEEQYRYLQTILQHVGVGLLSFRSDGHVDLINSAAKRLLRVANLVNIQSLGEVHRPLVETLLTLKPGERTLVRLAEHEDVAQLAIHATEFKVRGEKYTLISLQDIRGELEEKETEAWHSLIRVLTHEIMNSMTPIASLASTAMDLISSMAGKDRRPGPAGSAGDCTEDIQAALLTIRRRSQGLMNFVQAYRRLTLIPRPKFKIVPLSELFGRVEKLLEGRISEGGIAFVSDVDPKSLELTADPELIEQVLINLLLNAVDAVNRREGARVELKALMDARGRVVITIQDNGPGIIPEAMEKIFVPFFTTKKDGSGIGLSFSRQVMRLHHGSIRVHSEPNVQTTFTLSFY
ncbi:MAG: ATP-binding protein [Acidobacteriota bacterium]